MVHPCMCSCSIDLQLYIQGLCDQLEGKYLCPSFEKALKDEFLILWYSERCCPIALGIIGNAYSILHNVLIYNILTMIIVL